MKNPALRLTLTLLMYAGILACLIPVLSGRTDDLTPFLLTGTFTAIVCALFRHFRTRPGRGSHTLPPHPFSSARLHPH